MDITSRLFFFFVSLPASGSLNCYSIGVPICLDVYVALMKWDACLNLNMSKLLYGSSGSCKSILHHYVPREFFKYLYSFLFSVLVLIEFYKAEKKDPNRLQRRTQTFCRINKRHLIQTAFIPPHLSANILQLNWEQLVVFRILVYCHPRYCAPSCSYHLLSLIVRQQGVCSSLSDGSFYYSLRSFT